MGDRLDRVKAAEDLVLNLLSQQSRLVLAVAWKYITNREGFTRSDIEAAIDRELRKE